MSLSRAAFVHRNLPYGALGPWWMTSCLSASPPLSPLFHRLPTFPSRTPQVLQSPSGCIPSLCGTARGTWHCWSCPPAASWKAIGIKDTHRLLLSDLGVNRSLTAVCPFEGLVEGMPSPPLPLQLLRGLKRKFITVCLTRLLSLLLENRSSKRMGRSQPLRVALYARSFCFL